LLPDGDTLLLSIVRRTNASIGRWDAAEIVVQSLKTGVRKRLIEGGSDAQYVPTGHIVYVSDTTLFAVPFDVSMLAVTGGAVPVVDGVNLGATFGIGRTAHFAFSKSGSLVYVPGPLSNGQNLLLFDRKGGVQPLGLPAGRYQFPRVSPDGKRIAFEASDGKQVNVSIYELSGASSARRLTFGGNNRFPIWSADGRRVAFQSDRDGDLAVFWQSADGGTAERLTKPDAGTQHVPESWSPHDDVLLFSATKDFASSLWILSLRDRSAIPFRDVKDSTLPTDAMFSPDGRWVAYQMGTSAAVEATTFVQPFPPTGTINQIVPGGRPMWSRDGKEMFFVPDPGRFMAVTVTTTASTIAVTNPVPVPRGFGGANPQIARTFDIMPDGRIIGVGTPGQTASGFMQSQIHVVLNWTEELKQRVPTR
jgi:serine/threonine-protein kinase